MTADGKLAVIHGGLNGQMPDPHKPQGHHSAGSRATVPLKRIFEMTLEELNSAHKKTSAFIESP